TRSGGVNSSNAFRRTRRLSLPDRRSAAERRCSPRSTESTMSPTSSNDPPAGRRGKAVFVAGLAVGAALLWLAVRNVDASAIGASLLDADWKSVPVFLAELFLYYWLKAERWKRLLLPIKRI